MYYCQCLASAVHTTDRIKSPFIHSRGRFDGNVTIRPQSRERDKEYYTKVYFDSVSDRILYVDSAVSETPKRGQTLQKTHRLSEFTQFLSLVQIENYIKESMKMEMAQLQQSAVHNHTAAMLEMGTNLLSQTAEQTRKLTDVETQVMTHPRCDDDCASFRSALLTFMGTVYEG